MIEQLAKHHVRWMVRRDLQDVVAIEKESFDFPWVEAEFLHCLRKQNCIPMVVDHGGSVAGFMVYELFRDQIYLRNMAVAKQHRRSGIGQAMATTLLGKLQKGRRTRVTLHVRETNLDAQLFFKLVGFDAISVIREYYEETSDDAYLMQYRI